MYFMKNTVESRFFNSPAEKKFGLNYMKVRKKGPGRVRSTFDWRKLVYCSLDYPEFEKQRVREISLILLHFFGRTTVTTMKSVFGRSCYNL